MGKVLLAYYSRSGYTASLAREIASMTGWDTDEIIDVHPRDGNWGFVRCLADVLLHRNPAIRGASKNPAAYELVVLAAPVWMRSLAPPMRSYIAHHRGEFKALAFACTYGGRGADEAARQVAALSRIPLKASFAVTDQEFDRANYRAELDDFLRRVQKT